ncbi:MAG: DNA-binding protein [Thermoplasmata archaeon]
MISMMNIKDEIKKWLTSGSDSKEDVLDMVWSLKENNNLIIAEHPKIPFVLYIFIDEKFVRLMANTEVDTALLDPTERLDIYRKLLILNDRVNLVKYVISGTDEEIVLKADLDQGTFSKDEFKEAIEGIITSLYLMIKELNLEEEFNKMVNDRIVSMIQEKIKEGATESDLLLFLTKKVGLDKDSARKILDEIVKKEDYSEEYQ